MRYALFLGCTIPARLPQYESSARAVLGKLGGELVDIREFNCCGYPLRNTDHTAALLAAARNLALAEKNNLPLLTLCQCGYGMLRHAVHTLKEDHTRKEHITTILKKEGLEYKGHCEVKHLLSVLFHDIGVAAIKERITRPYQELKIATHYGCHALRPSEVVRFDDPVNPTLFDQLVEATGAESIPWQARLDCCGAPLFGSNDALSVELTEKKLTSAREAGAQFLAVSCPYCHMQFDTVQKMIIIKEGTNHSLAPILSTQLLGLSLGIDAKTLGLGMNRIDITSIEGFLSP
jgi:heterodisulfide reductase subunit B